MKKSKPFISDIIKVCYESCLSLVIFLPRKYFPLPMEMYTKYKHSFTVTFDQFNDYTIFKDTFCSRVLSSDCFYLHFSDRIVAKTDYSLFESEITSGYMTA